MKNLVVVESPSKAKTINKYLGKDYKVLASMGHIRNLPKKDGSVDVCNNFEMKYEISAKSSKAVKDLVDAMKSSDKLLLAPDPDREGEAIAWHIAEVLKMKKALKPGTPVERVVFNAITKSAVDEAIKNPRQIDMNLVNAQQARSALDYLVGFNLSPVLWRKLPGSKSAGRVQSVALRLVCEREEEIEKFVKQEYWTIDAELFTNKKEKIAAGLSQIDGKKLDKFFIKNEKQAKEISEILRTKKYKVQSVEKKQSKKAPYAPFTTSTLQQEASKKLGFSAKMTMSTAQRLYEGKDTGDGTYGLITYMRTDGVYTAPEAINAARSFIQKKYGEKYLPAKPIIYKNKVKNAQEAHEAIRPTNPAITPESIKQYLSNEEYKLYDLIWKRLVASQMESVVFDQVAINIETESAYGILRATGSVIKFDGFYALYNVVKEEVDDSDDENGRILPVVNDGEYLNLNEIKPLQHFTEPPARYSEASLVKKMEELGIGRPSTYATILSVIQEREYARLDKKRFIPEERGRIVTVFLKKFFPKYVEYGYTAKLEDDLDEISNGKEEWKKFLCEFWQPFCTDVQKTLEIPTSEVITKLTDDLKEHIFCHKDGVIQDTCPQCGTGKLSLKMGKFGAFIGCSNYPECKYIKNIAELTNTGDEETDKVCDTKFENKTLGQEDGQNIYLKRGPYGFYVQKGEDSTDKKIKPKRVSIPKTNKTPQDMTFEEAKSLLALPLLVGKHPEDGQEIRANIGPFGPYLMYNKKFYSVKNDDILTISAERAVDVIRIKDAAPPSTRGRFKKKEETKEEVKGAKTKKTSATKNKIAKAKVIKKTK